jgi:hypothetical protein
MHSAGSCRSNVGSVGHGVSVLLGLLYALTHRFECGWLTTQTALHHVPTASEVHRPTTLLSLPGELRTETYDYLMPQHSSISDVEAILHTCR